MSQQDFMNEKQEIEKKINQLKRKMRSLHNRQRRPVITSIIRSMMEYEITPEEIAKEFEKRSQRQANKQPAPARYINPQTQETWSGRGRPPRWISDAEAAGQSRDQFLIENN